MATLAVTRRHAPTDANGPPWPTVYGLFRRWQRDGTWDLTVTAGASR